MKTDHLLSRIRMDLTAKDVAFIEAALHTQQKILSVQSAAGNAGARDKLSSLADLLGRVHSAGVRGSLPSSRREVARRAASYLLVGTLAAGPALAETMPCDVLGAWRGTVGEQPAVDGGTAHMPTRTFFADEARNLTFEISAGR